MTATDRDALNELMLEHVNYWDHSHDVAVDAILAAGWRQPACRIATIEERDALPVGSIVVDLFEAGCTRISEEPPYGWVRVSSALPMGRQYGVPHLPATVLYVPESLT